MEARERTTPQALARQFPTESELARMLAFDPENINLRFCAVAHAMRRDSPDHIVITGDLTDDGAGFELIIEGLSPFFDQQKVSFVPGNHDTYPTPPLWVQKQHRKTEPEKRMLWTTFTASVGLPVTGSFARDLGSGVMLVCLDSCHRPSVPGSASGLVPTEELLAIARNLDTRSQQVRIACLHHHVVNPPIKGTGSAPLQAGMRLRNSREIFNLLRDLNFQVVMNGHRHVGYRYHPARAPLFLSAPSSTIGCRSGERPYYWRVETVLGEEPSIREVSIPPQL